MAEQSLDDPAPRPSRRTFTAEYKARILAEYETAAHGEKGAVLRREGLFHSHVREWAAARDAATLKALSGPGPAKNHPGRSREQMENDKLRAQNARLTRQLEQTRTALDIMGKARALGERLREHHRRDLVENVMSAAVAELQAAEVTTVRACALTGTSRATLHRRAATAASATSEASAPAVARKAGARVEGAAAARRGTSQSLSEAERERARALLTCPDYADLSIGQLWVRELDEGRYPCSLSSLYRIARHAGMTRERRRQATHPARVVPELVADGPSQVWTWDIERHEALPNRAAMEGRRQRLVAASRP